MRNIYMAILIFLSVDLYAQKDTVINMEEVIINENGLNTPISKQNRNVYVIDKAMIAKLPGHSLQEILQYANGVDIRQRGPFGTQADISIDVGSFEQTVVLVNGNKIIDSQTAHNMLNLPIPVEAIERIEIIRGPAARIYGINSLTGAVNFVTRKPDSSGFLISTYAGSNFEKDTAGTGKMFHGRGIQLGAALSKERHQHSIFGAHDKSNGTRFNTQFENNKLLYLGNYSLNDSNEMTTSVGYINNGFGANGFYAAPGDKNSDERVQTFLAAVQSRHELSTKWLLMPKLSYRYNDDHYRYYGKVNPNAGLSRHFTKSISGELHATYKTDGGELAVGTELRSEAINSSNIGEHNRENLGVYAQYRTYLLKQLNVNFGTYVNYNSDYQWQAYPGLDASYAINDQFKIIGNIGTSQRIPSFTDLYLNQPPGNIGNPDVKPENALQSELGVKYVKDNFTFNTNLFYRRISRFIDWTRTADTLPWQSNNVGKIHTLGFNMRVNYALNLTSNSRFNINLAYSYLDNELAEPVAGLTSKYQLSSLKHQVTNAINFQIVNLSVMAATRFNQRELGEAYWINDFRISQAVNKFSIFLDAQNVFNTQYYEIGAIPLPTRWLSLGLKFSSF